MNIGFIGIGVMGASIVKHLLAANYTVNVYTRTKRKAEDVLSLGAVWQDSPLFVAENSDIVFTMVGYPKDVEEVYFGEAGLFASKMVNKIYVDMTTSTPTLAKRLYTEGLKLGIRVLDAPVSGGDLGAKNGTLTMMVGGDESVYSDILPLVSNFTQKVHLHGLAGSGQHTKMANQIMIASTMIGMTELMVYAEKAGLDVAAVIDTVGGGSAANWSLTNYGPRILQEDYSPGFFVKHFVKDLKIALEEAETMNLVLPGLVLAHQLYVKLEQAGYEDAGTQALIRLWWQNK